MIANYLKIARRNLVKNKVFSFINIAGLALGMAVTILIGCWVWDELTYNHYHQYHDRIAQVMIRYTSPEGENVGSSASIPSGPALRAAYGDNFTHVVMASQTGNGNMSYGDKKLSAQGCFMEPGGPDMLSVRFLAGQHDALKDPNNILLSQSLATSLFGQEDPVGKIVRMDNRVDFTVAGLYEDIPTASSFSGAGYIAAWDRYLADWNWVKEQKEKWDFHAFNLYVQLAPNADIETVNQRISSLQSEHQPPPPGYSAAMFLWPMNKWRLYHPEGIGSPIRFVWLFAAIGVFVLLLACINFMNLSTARSEKRAREVGIRKAIGSMRSQLVGQFFSESVLIALIAFVLSVVLVQLAMPAFNQVAGKELGIPWTSLPFWGVCLALTLVTGLLAGSYPALYLSSFHAIKVLKGTYKAGRMAARPRQALVLLQFAVSVLLVIGTVTVFRQIQYAKDRPIGFNRDGLISVQMTTPQIYNNYRVIRSELINRGLAKEVSQSQGPVTDIWTGGAVEWQGKDSHHSRGFAFVGGTPEHGRTVGWKIVHGRGFGDNYRADSLHVLLNESAVRYMGVKDPLGLAVHWENKDGVVIGVVKDMVMASPYDAVPPTLYYSMDNYGNFVNVRMTPGASLEKIGGVFRQYNPAAPFEYTFAGQEFARKFDIEERIARISSAMTVLAIIISCMGLFGLASYIAEQRTKEIGIRKVLGASVFYLWRLLSRDFGILVLLACGIAIPLAWYGMDRWLSSYHYRVSLPWWVFASVGAGALVITLLTVSVHAVRVARMNPVRSLRSE
ncbi:ABC transporter permease [Chitinophaga lutea]